MKYIFLIVFLLFISNGINGQFTGNSGSGQTIDGINASCPALIAYQGALASGGSSDDYASSNCLGAAAFFGDSLSGHSSSTYEDTAALNMFEGGLSSGGDADEYTSSNCLGATAFLGDSLSGHNSSSLENATTLDIFQGGHSSGGNSNDYTSSNCLGATAFLGNSHSGYNSRSYTDDAAGICYTMARPEYISIINGNWNDINTWNCGCIPNTAGNITIRHNVNANLNFDLIEDRTLIVDVGGNLDITAVLNIDGNLNNNGDITGDLNITGTSSRLMNIGAVENLFMLTSGTISLSGDSYISRLLKLSSGTISANGYNAVLQASSSRTCLVHDDGGTTSGDFTVEQFIPQGANSYSHIFYGPPVYNPTISQLQDDIYIQISGVNTNSYYYNEQTGQWTPPSSFSTIMPPGKGWYQYGIVGFNGKTFDFEGELNTGTYTTPITNSTGGGWNIVSNPYPSPIDLKSLFGGGANPAVYYRYNGNGYNSFIAPVEISNPPGLTKYVPLMQGFWVNAGTSYTSVTFNNSNRVTDPAQPVDDFVKTTIPVFRLAMAYQTDTVTSAVYFFNAATDGVDEEYDALYLDGNNSFQFATKTGNTNMSINGLPELTGLTDTIPLYTEVTVLGNYSISLTELSNFSSGTKVMLQDLLLSVSHDLTKGDYSYIGNPVEGNDRFIITLLPNTVNTDPVEEETTFKVFKSNKILCISLPEVIDENRTIKIYNVLGQTLHTSTLDKGQQLFNISNLNLPDENIYFVDIEGFDIASKIVW